MFYVGECVRSSWYGLGEVVVTGDDPIVRFINDLEVNVPGNTLTIVRGEVVDAEVYNRLAIEEWLDRRLYGFVLPRPRPPRHDKYDLGAAMQRSGLPSPCPKPERPEVFVPDPLIDDLWQDADEEEGRSASPELKRVQLMVSRVADPL